MASVNKVILVGNLGKDPEQRVFANGNPVCSFSVATSENWKDKTTGERQEKTEWHNIQCFNRLAEIAAQYLKKGSQVYIEGKLQTRKWQDKNGNDRYTTEIVASEMRMLGGKPDNAAPRETTASEYRAAKEGNTPAPTRNSDDFDDDIPF